MTNFTGIAKINYNLYDGDERQATFKGWEKNGKSRIYVNDYKGRTLGFIDRNNENEWNLSDRQGLRDDEINTILGRFFESYEI